MKPYYQLVRHSGNQDLFRAVEMSIAALNNNMPLHIHAEGLRGTGKTTIMRSVKEILPPITRIKNCIYNCHPEYPHCPEHRNLLPEEIQNIGIEVVPCPFLEISHAAKIGTVVGSIDLAKLTNQNMAMAAILPGTIPQAHRGIIFIDEINRLADTSPELADVLLDIMGTKPGHIQIEETGMPTVELPVSVTIWAASNPDEEPGSLARIRKQLSDRFDFGINMGRPKDYKAVFNILEQRSKKELAEFDKQSSAVIGSLDTIIIDEYIRNIIARIYVDFNLESLRAVETIETAASLSCLMAGRQKVDVGDITRIVGLALSHRIDSETITAILKFLESVNSDSRNIENMYKVSSNNALQNAAIDEQYKKLTWWGKLRDNLREMMSFLNKFKRRSNSMGDDQEMGGLSSGSMKIIDPAKAIFAAPPKKAVAMRELPVEEFIKTEDNKSDG